MGRPDVARSGSTGPGSWPVPGPAHAPVPAGSRWSIGYSAVTVAPGPGGGATGGPVTGTSQRRGTPRTATTSLKVPAHPAAPRPAAGIRSPLFSSESHHAALAHHSAQQA